jgi:hypothetical protein
MDLHFNSILSGRHLILSILFLFMCVGCTRSSTFQVPDSPSSVFVRGFVDPSQGIKALISLAVNTKDTVAFDDILVKNASVFLVLASGIRLQIPYLSDGNYYLAPSLLPPLGEGDQCQIEIKVPGFDLLLSDMVTIPEKLVPDSMSYQLDGGTNGNSPTVRGYLAVKDSSPDDLGYLWSYEGLKEGYPPLLINPIEVDIANVCEVIGEVYQANCFGTEGSFKVITRADGFGVLPITFTEILFDGARLRAGKVSPEYAAFLKSLIVPDEWEAAFAEPPVIFSNIPGAYGVFYAVNSVTKEVVF